MKKMHRTIGVTVMSVALTLMTGCVNPNGTPNNTGTGALMGGAFGALVGAAADRGHSGAGALIGGAAGLIAGGLIGNAMDQQQQERLRQQYPQTWYKVQNNDAIYAGQPPMPPPPGSLPQTLDSAQAIGGGTSLSLPPGSQFYAFGMASGGARNSGPFANGQTVLLSNVAGMTCAGLVATTANNNNFATSTFSHAIAGFGASHFNYVQGFYGANPNPGAHSVSVQFTLNAPALVVLLGAASGQRYSVFSGLPNLVTDVPFTTPDAASVGHAYLSPGTYAARFSSPRGAGEQAPAYMADLLGVYIFSISPNAALSRYPQIPLPAFQPPPSTPPAVTTSTSPAATPATPPTAAAPATPASGAAQLQPFTLDDIKALTAAGVKADTITKEIDISQSKFSAQEIAAAQQAKPPIDPAVIACMQSHAG